MSGISEIKKKTKLSIDEMYDNESVGEMGKHKNGKMESKPSIQPAEHLSNNPDFHFTSNSFIQQSRKTVMHKTGQANIHQNGKLESHSDIRQGSRIAGQTNAFPTAKQQTQKSPTYKMTFNLTEDIYKAFNDLYATRMLKGRKTEKSEMICEAIQWLIKMEEEQTS
ncbi:hypothetical protein [Candidatus Protochlamydia sp. R18]|uniref:hypothetical protein n=1 Tax=Candidatus Protochlamydia sp. R18 TaxID=1353977 RepID=UPI0005A89652|nr:hypothetical protein [Candidatus Protochlamydia sp. R18]